MHLRFLHILQIAIWKDDIDLHFHQRHLRMLVLHPFYYIVFFKFSELRVEKSDLCSAVYLCAYQWCGRVRRAFPPWYVIRCWMTSPSIPGVISTTMWLIPGQWSVGSCDVCRCQVWPFRPWMMPHSHSLSLFFSQIVWRKKHEVESPKALEDTSCYEEGLQVASFPNNTVSLTKLHWIMMQIRSEPWSGWDAQIWGSL